MLPSEISSEILERVKGAGFSVAEEVRTQYLRTKVSIGSGSFGEVCEAYRPLSEYSKFSGRCKGKTRSSNGGYICVALKEMDVSSVIHDVQKMKRVLKEAKDEADILNLVRGQQHLVQSYVPWFNRKLCRLCFPMERAFSNLHWYVHIRWSDRPPEGYLLSIAWQLLLSLRELQRVGVVHRDVKPENFLVFLRNGDRDPPVVKLADFGLSIRSKDLQRKGCCELVGTPYFMSPECYIDRRCPKSSSEVRGCITPPARGAEVYARDVWAVGCVLYQLANGGIPFPGKTREEVERKCKEGARSLPSASRARGVERDMLHQLARRCFVPCVADRPTVEHLIQEMESRMVALHCSPLNRHILEPFQRIEIVERSANCGSAPPKVHQLMLLCREGQKITVYPSLPSKDGRLEPSICCLIHGQYVLMESEIQIKTGWAIMEGQKGKYPAVECWAKIVYPVRGFCQSELRGHHLLHPFEYRHYHCPPVSVPPVDDTIGPEMSSSCHHLEDAECKGSHGQRSAIELGDTGICQPRHKEPPQGQPKIQERPKTVEETDDLSCETSPMSSPLTIPILTKEDMQTTSAETLVKRKKGLLSRLFTNG